MILRWDAVGTISSTLSFMFAWGCLCRYALLTAMWYGRTVFCTRKLQSWPLTYCRLHRSNKV